MVTTPLKQQNTAPKLPVSPLFGTDGIRGKAGDLLTASFALQLGLSAGEVLKQQNKLRPIILGQDSRNSSDMLASAIASGLTAAGVEVWNLGICPTPCVAHITKVNDALGGIMISASHNPPEDNGIKFFGQGGTKINKSLSEAIESQLRKTYGLSHENPLNNTWGKNYHRSYLIQDYLENLVNSLPPTTNFTGLKIVLDLAWGASVNLGPSVFEQLGAEVIALHNEPNGNLINVNCGSTHLETIKQAVKSHNADLGFAFDGDADRVMAVDSHGRIIDGDYILYLWGKHLQEQDQLPDNLLIGTVMANLGFERAWEKLGGQLIRTAVGDKYVQAEMWRTGAMLGGEQSGHILCHHHGVSGDGLQTALHLTSLISQSGVSLSELVDQSFSTYPQILRNIRLNNRERLNNWHECEPLQKAISEAEKSLGNDGRVLVRASGTEPLIRVMVEAIDSELTNYWTNKLTYEVEKNLL